jgi:hypothetical protein
LACCLQWHGLYQLEQKEAQSSHNQIFQQVGHDSELSREKVDKDIHAVSSDWGAQGKT